MTMSESLRPTADDNPEGVLDAAIESLGALRRFAVLDDPGVRLHLLASLQGELHAALTLTVWDCQDHHYSWAEIAGLLGTNAADARARYDDIDPDDPNPA